MNTIVIEHVAVTDLPEAWRKRLPIAQQTKVRVIIEDENNFVVSPESTSAFGMWRDRDDLTDVTAHVRNLRAPRYERT